MITYQDWYDRTPRRYFWLDADSLAGLNSLSRVWRLRNACEVPMTRLNLTGDRPLTLRQARKLARWWQNNGWSANLRRVGRFFEVTASKQ